MTRPTTHLSHSNGRRVAGTDGDALVLGERHSLLCVDNQSYPGRVPGELGIFILVDIQYHLQPCSEERAGLSLSEIWCLCRA